MPHTLLQVQEVIVQAAGAAVKKHVRHCIVDGQMKLANSTLPMDKGGYPVGFTLAAGEVVSEVTLAKGSPGMPEGASNTKIMAFIKNKVTA